MIPNSDFLLSPLGGLSADMLWYVFIGAVLAFLIYSIFLVYHWFRYGMNILTSLLATITYAGVSGVILITAIVSFAGLLS